MTGANTKPIENKLPFVEINADLTEFTNMCLDNYQQASAQVVEDIAFLGRE